MPSFRKLHSYISKELHLAVVLDERFLTHHALVGSEIVFFGGYYYVRV